jgi:hypothetical protein
LAKNSDWAGLLGYSGLPKPPMDRPFLDRSEVLFGREPDLAYLLERCERSGLTAVLGRAQMGKSWLLTELARRLSLDEGRNRSDANPLSLLGPSRYLVGFIESQGLTADLLLRGAVDLYSSWLSDSSYREQARVVYAQQKKDIVGRVGKAFGEIFEKLSKLVPSPLESVGGLVKDTFDGLAKVNQEMLSGGVQLARLSIEQGRDLLALVHKITNCQIVLVLDQWEQSAGTDVEVSVLHSFLRHLEEWPPCHIFLGLRPGERPHAAVKQLEKGFPGAAEIYELPPMHLDESSGSALAGYVRHIVPAATKASDAELLDMISGYPGTVLQWTGLYRSRRLESLADMEEAAANAQAYRYTEFEELLPKLSESERLLSMRLALMPACGDAEGWKALKAIALEGARGRDLDALRNAEVLESVSPPSYGHAKRLEAVLGWFTDHWYVDLSDVCEPLVFSLASRVRKATPEEYPYLSSLVNLSFLVSKLSLTAGAQAICEAARTLFEFPDIDFERVLGFVSESNKVPEAIAPLLAMGLHNMLYQAERKGPVATRDVLFAELRRLGRAYPEDPTVRESLARGVYHALIYAKEDVGTPARREWLVTELRSRERAHPEDTAIRELLAKSVYNMLIYAKDARALDRRNEQMEELRILGRTYPEDAAVREQLAKGLLNSVGVAKENESLARRDELLKELQSLGRSNPKDAEVRRLLAIGLFNTLNNAAEEKALDRRDGLLDELRSLERAYPENAAVRELLAKGLLNTLVDAKENEALDRRDELLNELRLLARAYPEDAAVREWMTKGLASTLSYAKEERALNRRDELLNELRLLARAYPEDAIVREVLAKGLDITLRQGAEEEPMPPLDELLDELRALGRDYPADSAVKEILEPIEDALTQNEVDGLDEVDGQAKG